MVEGDGLPALARAADTSSTGTAAVAVVVVVLLITVAALVGRRRAARPRTPAPLPDVVHALAERGYLAFEPYDDDGTPQWLLHRRRLPDRTLSSCEHDWYFAIFGTRLASRVVWSEVRPPVSAG